MLLHNTKEAQAATTLVHHTGLPVPPSAPRSPGRGVMAGRDQLASHHVLSPQVRSRYCFESITDGEREGAPQGGNQFSISLGHTTRSPSRLLLSSAGKTLVQCQRRLNKAPRAPTHPHTPARLPADPTPCPAARPGMIHSLPGPIVPASLLHPCPPKVRRRLDRGGRNSSLVLKLPRWPWVLHPPWPS